MKTLNFKKHNKTINFRDYCMSFAAQTIHKVPKHIFKISNIKHSSQVLLLLLDQTYKPNDFINHQL